MTIEDDATATVVAEPAADDEPTVVAEPRADEPTAVAEPAAEDESTLVAEPVAEAEAAAETADESAPAETEESLVEEPVVAQAESEAEEAAAAEEAAGADEPVAEETVASQPAAEDETAEGETADGDTAHETAADVAAMFEKLNPRVAPGDDDQERTQVIRLPAGELVTHDLRGRITPVMPPPDDRPTRVINRGALRGSEPGERTQVIRMPQKPEPAKPGPAKPGPPKAKPPTAQPPKPEPARTKATDEAERTQVIRLGAGTVDPPDERTQVIKLPARTETRTASRMEEEPAEKTTPKGPSSVMGAERPNFAEDPTTRLMPPRVDDPDAENGNSRTMTVTNLERPADELADDLTRPLVPGPRSPESDQS
jgi:hypothetical protein